MLTEDVLRGGRFEFDCVAYSPKEMTLIGMRTSCGCLWTEDLPVTLHGGELKNLKFFFDPTRRNKIIKDEMIEVNIRILGNAKDEYIVGKVKILPNMDVSR